MHEQPRQIGIAMHNYATDEDGSFPVAASASGQNHKLYTYLLRPYIPYVWNGKKTRGGTTIWHSPNGALFSTKPGYEGQSYRSRGYAINKFIAQIGLPNNNNFDGANKIAWQDDTSTRMLMGDAGYGLVSSSTPYNTETYIGARTGNLYPFLGDPGSQYSVIHVFRAGNTAAGSKDSLMHVLFVDGHVSPQPMARSKVNIPAGITYTNSPSSNPTKYGPYE